jgi:PBP1b-binding outer membrane lipoprotein LpoB
MRPIEFARLTLALGLTLLLAGCVTAGQAEAEHAQQEQQQADAAKSRALDAEMAAINKNCRVSYVACDQQRYHALVRVWGSMNDDNELLWRKRLVIDEQLDKGQITLLQADAMNAEDTAEVTARRRQVNAAEQAAQAATLMGMEMDMPR